MSLYFVREVGITFVLVLFSAFSASALDWTTAASTDVVEILTLDADGAAPKTTLRTTKVWIIVDGDHAFVRTNDSVWLANIRRGSSVRVRVDGREDAVRAEEIVDSATLDRVEKAFLAKYGTLQRVMSALRWSEPTVLRLTGE